MAVVDEGEVEGEPQQQVVVVGHASMLQDDSEPIHVGEVLLQAAQLFMELLANSQAAAVMFHRAFIHGSVK